MANRVNARLGGWATADDGDLAGDLTTLLGSPPDAEMLAGARRLFARVLDVPGGLKIQTVHGFCRSLLARFPLEAGVAPHFKVLDERTAAELLDAARDRVLARAAGDKSLTDALDAVTAHLDEQRFGEVMGQLARDRHRLGRLIEENEGIGPAIAQTWRLLSLERHETDESILAAACKDAAFEGDGLKRAARALLEGSGKTDKTRGQAIADWLAAKPKARADMMDDYLAAFLTGQGEIRARLATAGVQKAFPEIVGILETEGARLVAMRDRRAALVTALATAGLLRLGDALLEAYGEAKAAIAKLDYDDLILMARGLLKTPGIAPWVLFKLDGGLDHILIDEAQDTGPEQWEVIAALADEFFAGEGARETARTIFAVGDVKQSIYSFQRADPAEFRRMREHFAARVENAGGTWRPVDLDVSYRSTSAVLSAVDAVFTKPDAAAGVLADDETIHHRAWRTGQAGLVELWPPVGPRDDGGEEDETWVPPLERRAGDDPMGRLARVVAARIAGWLGSETLASRGRTMRAGDVMVLLRKRDPFIEPLVRALKDNNVAVSGVDRMVLSEQLAVMDLVVLGRFLLLPEDDLTLATVLKGPLAGFDDDDLFRLAWDRKGKSLWRRLREEAKSEPRFEAARAWLAGLMSRVDYLRPYELFAEVLGQPACGGAAGRRRMLARLGPDADDPIDEFLGLALAYESGRAASLEGFLHWLAAGEAQVKRDLEQTGRDEVRVMTVHGAKGLQAPVVILPDTMSKPKASPLLLWSDEAVLWPPRRSCEEQVAGALRDAADRRRDEEYNRLLYVAMTRAEDRLYVCGAHGRQGPSAGCWWELVRDGLDGLALDAEFDFGKPAADGWSGAGLRLEGPQETEPSDRSGVAAAAGEAGLPEDWMLRPPPLEPAPPRPLAPSRPSLAEPAVESPLGGDRGRRFRRGLLIHRLLQTLPDRPPEHRRAAADRFLARPVHELDAGARAEIAGEVMAVLDHADFHALFGPGSRAEVPVTGRIADGRVISGQIDRLVVTGDSVLILDYKTNRPPPRDAAGVPDAYWRQMAAYRAIIGGIYPDRPVRCALLWTDGPNLMELSGPRLDLGRLAP
jgi:ATP-dependent helicase/nuclease subunit A